MSWTKALYGTTNPSIVRKLLVLLSIPVCIASVWGLWANFLPNPVVDAFGFYFSIVVALALTTIAIKRVGKRGLNPKVANSNLVQWFVALAMPFFFWYFGWAAFGHGIPAAITAITGHAYSEKWVLEKKLGGGRLSCNFRLDGRELASALPAYICVKEAFFNNLPSGKISIKVMGRKSWFGELYRTIEPG